MTVPPSSSLIPPSSSLIPHLGGEVTDYGKKIAMGDNFFPIEVPSYVTVNMSRSYILPNRRLLNIMVDEV